MRNEGKIGPEVHCVLVFRLLLQIQPDALSSVTTVWQMSNIKTSDGRGRAWIAMALMEKRLHVYLTVRLKLLPFPFFFQVSFDLPSLLSSLHRHWSSTRCTLRMLSWFYCCLFPFIYLSDSFVIAEHFTLPSRCGTRKRTPRGSSR